MCCSHLELLLGGRTDIHYQAYVIIFQKRKQLFKKNRQTDRHHNVADREMVALIRTGLQRPSV